MADDFRGLEERVRELEQIVRELLNRQQRNVLGTRSVPVTKLFLRDSETGSIAEVDYDSAASGLRTTKVR